MEASGGGGGGGNGGVLDKKDEALDDAQHMQDNAEPVTLRLGAGRTQLGGLGRVLVSLVAGPPWILRYFPHWRTAIIMSEFPFLCPSL